MKLRVRGRLAAGAGLAGLICALASWPAAAEPFKLAPNTKVQVSIIQWNLAKGAYERMDALGGTFVVSLDERLSLPIIGQVDVADKSTAEVAHEISTALREKVGFLSEPEVMVDVVEYPPVYVVGVVTNPGMHAYQPGLTVLQALALSGGRYRGGGAAGRDVLSLGGDLKVTRTDVLRMAGRVARLEAELKGADEITFPPEVTDHPNKALTDEIVGLEQSVFSARSKEAARQIETLSELRDLYDAEIGTLNARAEAGDHSIEVAAKQLEGVSQLYERGVATLSRQLELERSLSELKLSRLANDTETMRARQGRSETLRQELSVEDQRQSTLALELRDARADFDRLKAREVTLERLLAEAGGAEDDPETSTVLVYSIVRNRDGDSITEIVGENAVLEPGDVLKIEAVRTDGPDGQAPRGSADAAAPDAATDTAGDATAPVSDRS